jgi:hypothetical protein
MVKMVNITLYTFSQNFYKVKKCQRKILLRVHNRQIINQQCIWAWCCLPVISAVQRLRQEDHELEDSLGYTARPYFKKLKQKIKMGLLARWAKVITRILTREWEKCPSQKK